MSPLEIRELSRKFAQERKSRKRAPRIMSTWRGKPMSELTKNERMDVIEWLRDHPNHRAFIPVDNPAK